MPAFSAAVLLAAATLAHAAPIDNGVEIAPSEYGQVVKLDIVHAFMCTGTLIGPNTILTAAHCLDKTSADDPSITISFPDGTETSALRALVSPSWKPDTIEELNRKVENAGDWSELDAQKREKAREAAIEESRLEQYDLGLVEIAPTSRTGIPVGVYADASALVGMPVTLVGYGQNDQTAVLFGGGGTERKGTNRILGAWKGLLCHAGEIRDRDYRWGGLVTHPDGKNVGTDHGDSGGPMIANGQVIGVNVADLDASAQLETLRQEMGPTGERLYQMTRGGKLGWNISVSLSSPESAELFALAKTNGFRFAAVQNGSPEPSSLKPHSATLSALAQAPAAAFGR